MYNVNKIIIIFLAHVNNNHYLCNRNNNNNTQVPEGQKTMILIIAILGGYALGIYVGRNWDKYTTE